MVPAHLEHRVHEQINEPYKKYLEMFLLTGIRETINERSLVVPAKDSGWEQED